MSGKSAYPLCVDYLKAVLAATGQTPTGLARQIGVSHTTITRAGQGQGGLGADILQRIEAFSGLHKAAGHDAVDYAASTSRQAPAQPALPVPEAGIPVYAAAHAATLVEAIMPAAWASGFSYLGVDISVGGDVSVRLDWART